MYLKSISLCIQVNLMGPQSNHCGHAFPFIIISTLVFSTTLSPVSLLEHPEHHNSPWWELLYAECLQAALHRSLHATFVAASPKSLHRPWDLGGNCALLEWALGTERFLLLSLYSSHTFVNRPFISQTQYAILFPLWCSSGKNRKL